MLILSQEVAQSLPLDTLSPGAAEALAGDVEYRIHLIIQEAKKFMIHGRRGTLLPEDIEHAMEALNVEVGVVNRGSNECPWYPYAFDSLTARRVARLDSPTTASPTTLRSRYCPHIVIIQSHPLPRPR